jgi:hypothetical protein
MGMASATTTSNTTVTLLHGCLFCTDVASYKKPADIDLNDLQDIPSECHELYHHLKKYVTETNPRATAEEIETERMKFLEGMDTTQCYACEQVERNRTAMEKIIKERYNEMKNANDMIRKKYPSLYTAFSVMCGLAMYVILGSLLKIHLVEFVKISIAIICFIVVYLIGRQFEIV